MNKRRLLMLLGVCVVMTMLAVGFPLAPAAAQKEDHSSHSMNMQGQSMHAKMAPHDLEQVHKKDLPLIRQVLANAVKAVNKGNDKQALVELQKAQKMLDMIGKSIGHHVKPKFANNRCPIMGSPINPTKVKENLIRDFDGQKVAFCCAGCPAQWDKLTKSQKGYKLAKVKTPVKDKEPSSSPHKH